MISLAPCLAAFKRLRKMPFHFQSFTGADALGWPHPQLRLVTLESGYWYLIPASPEPSLAELQWLTASSRESLRRLDIVSYSHGIVSDILQWGPKLHSLRFGVFY